ncbi:MAG TPA: hypothetical protein VKF17_16810 [Isosphaeraceae bacterium]|nr:hypothetical protein [Isosphaeraceae bacterium]
MSTLALIQAVLADQTAKTTADAALVAAQAADTVAASQLATDSAALFADLTANGPAVTVDELQTPPVVVEYTPVAPASFLATPIRVAV